MPLQALCQSEGDRELDGDGECGRRDKQDNNAPNTSHVGGVGVTEEAASSD